MGDTLKHGDEYWIEYWLGKEPNKNRRNEIERAELIPQSEVNIFLDVTFSLMEYLGIEIRDTFSKSNIYDHHWANGGIYNGQRQIRLYWTDSYTIATSGGKKYDVPNQGLTSQAWDLFWATIPPIYRDQQRNDPIVHECVHFLQHSTAADESNYIQGGLSGSVQYRHQRLEREAHLVQVAYLIKHAGTYVDARVSVDERKSIKDKLDLYLSDKTATAAIDVIDTARHHKLI